MRGYNGNIYANGVESSDGVGKVHYQLLQPRSSHFFSVLSYRLSLLSSKFSKDAEIVFKLDPSEGTVSVEGLSLLYSYEPTPLAITLSLSLLYNPLLFSYNLYSSLIITVSLIL